jgi:hypothetical protein
MFPITRAAAVARSMGVARLSTGAEAPVFTPRVTRASEVDAKRWAELDAAEVEFQKELSKTSFAGLRHCAAGGYWPRLKYVVALVFFFIMGFPCFLLDFLAHPDCIHSLSLVI